MTAPNNEFQNVLAGVDRLFNQYHLDVDRLMALCEDVVTSNEAILNATADVIPESDVMELKLRIHTAENIGIFLRCLAGYRESLGF